MKKHAIVAALILAVSLAYGQSANPNSSFRPEEPLESQNAVCGDGVCSTIERGVCPQDCTPNTSGNNTGEPERDNRPSLLLPAAVTIAVIIVLAATAFWLYRKGEEDEEELSKWMKEKKKKGYSMSQLEKYLIKKGYSKQEIREAENSLNRDQN